MIRSDGADIDRSNVEAWMVAELPELQVPFTWDRLAGGHSNLTFLLRDGAGREVVVRRPPAGELKPGAHDMDREFRIISGLWGTGVPVPQPLAYCEDRGVTGVPFYVMAYVDGRVMPNAAVMRQWLPTEAIQRRVAESFADSLADLHLLPPETVRFEGTRRPEEFVGRQLRAWYRSWGTGPLPTGSEVRRRRGSGPFRGRSQVPLGISRRGSNGDPAMRSALRITGNGR